MSYLAIIERLALLEPPAFIFGGVAEDALLDSSITRPHGDVDVLVGRASLDLQLAQLDAIGFTDFDVYFEPQPEGRWSSEEHTRATTSKSACSTN